MYEELYTKKENAIQRVRELYLSGNSLLEIRDCIKSELLIDKTSDINATLLITECFCLEFKYVKLISVLFSSGVTDKYYFNNRNQDIVSLIEENKSKWNV